MTPRRTARGSHLSYLAYRAGAALAGRVPRRAAEPAAAFIGGLFHRLSDDRRAIHARHLQRAAGRPLGRAALERMLARSFRSYGRYWLEVLSADRLDREFVRTALDLENEHLLREAMDSGTGCVLALAHMGNWDLAGAWLAAQGWKVSSVAEVLEPPEMFEFFCDVRRRMGINVYPLDGTSAAARGLLSDLRDGASVALLAERDLTGDGVEVEFFGERTTVPSGPAALALRSGAPLMPAAVYQKDGGRCDAVVRPPVERPAGLSGRAAVAAMAQAVVRELEDLIRRAPEQWHLYQPNWPSDHGALRSSVSARPALRDRSSAGVPRRPGAATRRGSTGLLV